MVGSICKEWAARARGSNLDVKRALLRALVDTIPDAMVGFDELGLIRVFNPGAVKTLGYEPQQAFGKPFTVLAPEADGSALAAAFDRYLKTGVAQYLGRVSRGVVRRLDGAELVVEIRGAETRTNDARLFIFFLRDLSETLANEERLGSLAAELGHAARLSTMGEMAAGMAHELNQPLTALANYTGAAAFALGEGGDLAQVRELVAKANAQALRAGEIIRRIREFAASKRPEVETVSVREVIRGAVALVFVGLMPRRVKLAYEFDPRATTMIADSIQIQQVLVNLLRNSVHAMRRSGSPRRQITISTALRDNGMIEFALADTGPGVSPAAHAAMFTPFSASTDKAGDETGLSICRPIVEAHGGEIWSEDRDGGGTIFRFTVPMVLERDDPGE